MRVRPPLAGALLLLLLTGCSSAIQGQPGTAVGGTSADNPSTSATSSPSTGPTVIVEIAVGTADGTPLDPATMELVVADLRQRIGQLPDAEITEPSEGRVRITTGGEDPEAVVRLLHPTSLAIRPVVGFPSPALPDGPGPVLNDDPGRPQQPATAADSEAWKQQVADGMDSWRCPPAPAPVFAVDPTVPLLTCDADGAMVYLLDPALITGADVAGVRAAAGTGTPDWTVQLTLTADGLTAWSGWTATHIGELAGITVGGTVVSAPSVQSAITDPTTQISASQTEAQASELAARMELGRFGVQYTVISTQVVR